MPSTSRLLLPRPAASCLAASRRRRRSSLFRWLVVAVVVLVRLSVCQSPRRAEENNIDRRSLHDVCIAPLCDPTSNKYVL